MKKTFLLLISLLLASVSASAVNYFTIGGIVNDTLLINPSFLGTGRNISVGAHFDGRVDEWTINMYYPATKLSIYNISRGSDMDIPYTNNVGAIDTCHAQLTVSSDYSVISSSITEFGYWDYDNDGIYEPYGKVKWEAGDYEDMFKIYFNFDFDCTGDSITFSSDVDGSYDWRGGTTNGMFCNKIYLKVGYLLGDVNADGQVTIADVTALMNYLSSHEGLDQYQLDAADVNRDGEVTISDITALINLLLQQGAINSIEDIDI